MSRKDLTPPDTQNPEPHTTAQDVRAGSESSSHNEWQQIPLWFSLAIAADALVVGAGLWAHGWRVPLAVLVILAVVGAVLHGFFPRAAR